MIIARHTCATSHCIQPANPRKLSSFTHAQSPFRINPCKFRVTRRRCKHLHSPAAVVALMTDPGFFEVGRFVGSYGFMNVTSYSSFQTEGFSNYEMIQDIDRFRVQNVEQGQVQIRIYEGRVIQGRLRGTDVLFKKGFIGKNPFLLTHLSPKLADAYLLAVALGIICGQTNKLIAKFHKTKKVYPGRVAGGMESDLLAANELATHAFLQEDTRTICENIQFLLGAFETITGEQWLAFSNDGRFSATDYAKFASENISKGLSNNFPIFIMGQNWKRRRNFVIKLLNGAMNGLAHMHRNDRLHQSLGPASVAMNSIMERDEDVLVPRLRDLAFSVDIRYTALGDGSFSQDLWRRGASAGVIYPFEKRAFAIADDIYEAGFLFAYLAFVPFCEAGVIDGISLQRLIESTFQLDLSAVREYCSADDRLAEAVKFLDLGGGAGWELLQAMLNPNYKKRPTAEAVLNHRFMTGAVL